MEILGSRLVRNATVYPTIRLPSHPGKLLMGVFDEAGTYVEGSALDRRAGEQGAPIPRDIFAGVAESDAPEAIYAGTLFYHFGHFLLESLARAWYARRNPDLPFVWAGAHTWQGFKLKPWQSEILEILGIVNPCRIIADPTRFEALHVPDVGYRYDDRFHPEHAAFFAAYAGPPEEDGARLWLSRSRLSSDVRDLNADPTERRLSEAGWVVSHPEQQSVREQLDNLSRAQVIAGEEGSAFHTLMLLQDVSSKRLHVFRRHGPEHRNMTTIGDALKLDQTFHTLANERIIKASGRVVSKVTPNSSEILNVLDVPIQPAGHSSARSDDTERVTELLSTMAVRRHLEVGVTSLSDIPTLSNGSRVVVSQELDFDPRQASNQDIEFYELPLGSYSEHFHADSGPFDTIHIAAGDLNEFWPLYTASKKMAHGRTIWILGSDPAAARAATAIHLVDPGYSVARTGRRGDNLYIAMRDVREPASPSDVAAFTDQEIARRARRIAVTTLRQLAGRFAD